MMVKAVCLTSASLAMHSNLLEELQKLCELQNYNNLIDGLLQNQNLLAKMIT